MASSSFHTKVGLRGFYFEDSIFTFNLANTLTANHVGQPVALDTSAPNTVKPLSNNDEVFGKLASYEGRAVEGTIVGAVELRFTGDWAISGNVNVGDTVVGSATANAVKAVANATAYPNRVVEVTGGKAVVVKI